MNTRCGWGGALLHEYPLRVGRRGPHFSGPSQNGDEPVEFATLTWVDWVNTRRLLGPLGDIPPAEFEAQYYAQAEVA